MRKSGLIKLPRHIAAIMLATVALYSPIFLSAQGYLKSQVRNTNCEIANHEADRWFFGQNAALDFRPQDPVADLSNWSLNIPTSSAIMADSSGNLLFYTDGNKVWSRTQSLMDNGDSLNGFVGYTMPAIIVPKPGSENIYYIFTTHRPKQNPNDPKTIYGLEYNEVDISLNGGLGAVTKKNKVLLQPEVSSKLTAIKHSNGVDYWVVGHRFNSNEFCAFRVTSNGVDTTGYVSSALGTVHAGPGETNNGIGYMKISPDGTKLALAIHGSDIYEIYNFDTSSGKVTNAIISSPIFNEAYGIEFSSDSRYLYGTTTSTSLPQPNYTPPSYLYQFDISLGANIFINYTLIAEDTLGSYFGGIQLGTDGRIYVSRSPYGNAALGVIENPKRPGLACNYSSGAMDLLGKRSRFGFPNFMQSYFDLPHFDVENICYVDTTLFVLQNNSNIDNVTWQFGDPTSGSANTSTAMQPTHVFSGTGSFTVEVTEFFNGVAYGPYSETVIVNDLPMALLPDTVYMYPGSPIILDAGEGFTSYEWSSTELTYPANTQTIKVNAPGVYYVTVQNEKCCFNGDSSVVILFDVYVPNAFRPGGTNNIFKAVPSSDQAISNFALFIYNRWGQEIFYSEDIELGWDGKVNGKDAPGDVYVWLVNYDIEREGRTERIAYKGNVILLR